MDRITNESNLWLNAIKMEDEGSFLEASFLYLKDAAESLQQNSLVKAALSCSCASKCLSMTGNLEASRQLYLQTAMLYEINGDTVIGESVREALWSYQECYEYYNLVCNSEKAQIIHDKYVSLVRRTNPFLGEEEAMQSMRQRRKTSEVIKSDINQTDMQVSTQVANAMESVLKAVESIYAKMNLEQSNSEQRNQSRVKKFEKSLTS